MVLPASLYYFTNANFNGKVDNVAIPSGTECIYTITAYGPGDFPHHL